MKKKKLIKKLKVIDQHNTKHTITDHDNEWEHNAGHSIF